MTTKSEARAQAAHDAMIKAAEAHKALVAIPFTPEQKRALVAYAEAGTRRSSSPTRGAPTA